MSASRRQPPTGVGLGLRWAFIDEVAAGPRPAADHPPSLPFFEVSPENYMRRGGSIPRALHAVAERHPIITHGLMMNVGGSTELDPTYLRQLRAFLERMGAPWHSDHLCWTGSDGAILHDLLPLPHDAAAVRRCVERILRIQDALGLPFAVENISYYLVPAGSMPEAEMITEVLERADCRLLLDVNNVQVNADNHGFDAWAFIDALPLSRVVQLHVAGGERRPKLDGLVIDTHGTDVSLRVQALMSRVIERIGPTPVIYERDHDIPPLPELARQVAALQLEYDAALARHRAAAPTGPSAARQAFTPASIGSLDGVQRGMSSVVLHPEGERELPLDPPGWLLQQGVVPPDHHAMAEVGPRRLLVYRSLVRAGLESVVRSFLPRTIARLGEQGLARAFDAWLHAAPPRSRFLRDVPGEFVEWARTAWPSAPAVPEGLTDLARLEILESEVDAADDPPAPPDLVGELVLDRPLVLTGALRIASFDHAVHELPRAEDDRSTPARMPTTLLLYRDAHDRVRTMTLSPLARAVLERLLDGTTVAAAIPAGAAEVGLCVDDALLGRLSVLLADLAERGVLRGSRPA
jgi:uncharacterized protein (UPF0276 family)